MIPGETVLSQGEAGLKDPHNGEFKVMRSQGSGLWYIGTMFLSCGNPECNRCGKDEYPHRRSEKGLELDYGSRETDYFDDQVQADAALKEFKRTGNLPHRRY